MLYVSTFRERASAGKWTPAIPTVKLGPAYDPPWAWLCGPGPEYMACDFLYIYQTTTKLRNRNSSYNQPAYNLLTTYTQHTSRSLPATRESLLTMLVCAFFIPSFSPPPLPTYPSLLGLHVLYKGNSTVLDFRVFYR